MFSWPQDSHISLEHLFLFNLRRAKDTNLGGEHHSVSHHGREIRDIFGGWHMNKITNVPHVGWLS